MFGAISAVGDAHSGADNTDNGAGVTGPTATLTPVTSQAGDLILCWMVYRADSKTWTISDAAGQNWHRYPTQQSNASTSVSAALFWCIFNGTWGGSGAPIFTVTSGTSGVNLLMTVLRGVDNAYPLDELPTFGFDDVAGSTLATGAYSTLVDGCWALFFGASRDDNTWTVDNTFVTFSGAGNIYWRELSGSDNSIAWCKKTITSAGAVGVTTLTQASLGADGGAKVYFAVRPATAARRGATVS
jgi:hypothetical protein